MGEVLVHRPLAQRRLTRASRFGSAARATALDAISRTRPAAPSMNVISGIVSSVRVIRRA